MKHADATTCPSCGARVAEDAEVCDLCGTPLATGQKPAPDGPGGASSAAPPAAPTAEDPVPPPEAHAEEEPGVFCNQCGWKNPLDARFCSQCGTRLQELRTAPSSTPAGVKPAEGPPAVPGPPPAQAAADAEAVASTDDTAVGRQIAILVGAGVLLVVALFLINAVSSQNRGSAGPRAGSAAAPAQQAPARSAEEILQAGDAQPLPPQIEAQVEQLKDEIARLDETAGTARRKELINLYIGSGQYGPAAVEQEKVAEQEDSFEAWARTGNLFYDWMETLQGQQKFDVARLAVEAYQRALAHNPDALDVRTDMATAFLNTNNPMEGVNQIKQVLAADPDHVQANFNYGYMLMIINRLDQAEEQFERVQEIVGAGSPYYNRAEELREIIREQRSQTPSS